MAELTMHAKLEIDLRLTMPELDRLMRAIAEDKLEVNDEHGEIGEVWADVKITGLREVGIV